jgi:alpha-tubulin suppressor-like RCC1 family protein
MSTYNPVLRKVTLPGPAADIYATDHDPVAPSTGVNLGSHNNSFFILADGRLFGTGADNYGQLGRGGTITGDYVTTPVQMQLPAGVTARSVQAGYGTTVVISSTGQVYTVGNNSNGQLGDGSYTSSSIPKANQYTNQRSTISY